jgi:alcohol dehydrogenase class IV
MEMNLHALRAREPKSFAIGRYFHVAELITGNGTATAGAGIEWIRELVKDFAVPRLGYHGIEPEHADEIVKNAMNASSMKANPIALTAQELKEVLLKAI